MRSILIDVKYITQKKGIKMKVIEKIILVIYSIIMIILASVCCLLIFRWLDVNGINEFLNCILSNNILSNIILVVSIIFILASIKCIFFLSKKSDYYKDNLLLRNEDGKLIIAKATIENLVNNAISGFTSAQEVNTRVKFNKENNIIINVILLVKEETNIKELSNNIQSKVKEIIKRTSDLNVQEINIKIKNIQKEDKNISKEIER